MVCSTDAHVEFSVILTYSIVMLMFNSALILYRWDKKPLRNRETIKFPMAGRFMETLRRGSMLATHAMMGFGKDPTM